MKSTVLRAQTELDGILPDLGSLAKVYFLLKFLRKNIVRILRNFILKIDSRELNVQTRLQVLMILIFHFYDTGFRLYNGFSYMNSSEGCLENTK